MTLEVLISCMHEKDYSIVERTNIQTDVVVINQCDKDLVEEKSFVNKKGKKCRVKFVNTTERGLSRSRNMAIKHASSDICLLCDDDEELADDYEDLILDAFGKTKQADIIAFNIKRPSKKPFDSVHKLGYVEALKVSSVHIAFKRKEIQKNNIHFDIKLGSGSGNGGGEDTKFMKDCRDKGLSQWSNPSFIGSLNNTSKSLWFHGFDKQYFIDFGWTSHRVYGGIFSVFTIMFYTIKHLKDYCSEVSLYNAIKYSFIGWRMKR